MDPHLRGAIMWSNAAYQRDRGGSPPAWGNPTGLGSCGEGRGWIPTFVGQLPVPPGSGWLPTGVDPHR